MGSPNIHVQPIVTVLAARRLRQNEVAEAVGVSPSHLNRCCRGRARPSPLLIHALANLLGVDPASLFLGGQ